MHEENLARAISDLACAIREANCKQSTETKILHRIDQMERHIMKTLADLDAEIQGELTDAATGIETALANALAQITVPPDVQPEFDKVAAIAAALKAAVTPSGPPLAGALKSLKVKRTK